MKIIIGKTAGFCYGVSQTVTKTMEQLNKFDNEKSTYCLGEIVHNKQVVDKLEKMGLQVVENVEDINCVEKANVIIRAHGVEPMVYEKINKKNYNIVDLTCPNVLAIHKLVQKFSDEESYIFLIGQKSHPEIIGTYGYCKYCTIIEKEEDIVIAIENLKKTKINKLVILVQTTFSLEKFKLYVDVIKKRLEDDNLKYEVEVRNTICNATKLRQEETEELSKKVDYMIIIGGKNSSNTRKLFEIASKNCEKTICIETEKELEIEKIIKMEKEKLQDKNSFTVGIMAGASTPKESIENVELTLNNIKSEI